MNKPNSFDSRNRGAFRALVASRQGLTVVQNRNEAKLLAAWLNDKACPTATERSMDRAARILAVPREAIIATLWEQHQSVSEVRIARALQQRIRNRGDMNQDGTYNHTCAWCGRAIVRPTGLGTPTCTECQYGNQHWRRRRRSESGMARAADQRRRALTFNGASQKTNWRRPGWHYLIMAEFGYCCAYCGMTRIQHRAIHRVDLAIDHIIPLVSGGQDAAGNMAPACRSCNSGKCDADMMEWAVSKGLTPHPLAVQRYNALMSRTPMAATSHG